MCGRTALNAEPEQAVAFQFNLTLQLITKENLLVYMLFYPGACILPNSGLCLFWWLGEEDCSAGGDNGPWDGVEGKGRKFNLWN